MEHVETRPDYRRSRILRLALLAPDIVEATLAGRTDQALMLEKLERPLPASWKARLEHLRREPVRSMFYRFPPS
jgi:hypothetical protein